MSQSSQLHWTVAFQAPLSMRLSKQEYWSGCHSLLQGIFLMQGSNPGLLHRRQILYCLSPLYQLHKKKKRGNLSLFMEKLKQYRYCLLLEGFIYIHLGPLYIIKIVF